MAALLVTTLLSFAVPALAEVPEAITVTTRPIWAKLVQWINVNFFDELEAVKTFVLLNLLVPVKRFMLGLPWPGGPHLERLAQGGDASRIALPRPLLGRPGCDFSFSGLKTAVAQALAKGLDEQGRRDKARQPVQGPDHAVLPSLDHIP